MAVYRMPAIIYGWAIAFCVTAGCEKEAHGAHTKDWATGADFQLRLTQPVNIYWSGDPLRTAIQNLAESQQIAVLIDRRIDPSQRLTTTLKHVPLRTALQTIAEQNALGVSRLGDVVYLGPEAAATRLRPIEAAVKQRVRQLPMPVQQQFFREKAITWNDLASPRELLEQLAHQNNLTVTNPNRIPHDLWAAVELPPLSLIDRLVLIASQFDLTFNINVEGTTLELVPVPNDLPDATNPFTEPTSPRPWKSTPRTQPRETGSAQTLDRVRIQRLTIQDEQLGSVLQQLANRLGLELKMDEEAVKTAGISLDQRVTVTIENASVDELLRQLLKPVGLIAHRRHSIVEITPVGK
jgi:hypothetical protein